jgi:hypothetical protein
MTTPAHIQFRGAPRRLAAALLVLATLGAARGAGLISPAGPADAAARNAAASRADYAYTWPIKPFDRPHPVRANFGDPRTLFHAAPSQRALMSAAGSFSFHFGIDIAAPNGTPVYAVRSGTASLLSGATVQVTSGHGFAAQYWHIIPAVHAGEHVVADVTVLGRTLNFDHVHFTELRNGGPVNPLAPGHLGPFEDTTRPEVTSISFRRPDRAQDVAPEFVHGSVEIVAACHDMPAMAVPGLWSNLPIAPARITWRIERARDRGVVSPEQTAFDVRSTLPPNSAFWRFYARGSRQNMPTFGSHRFWLQPGVYLYPLTHASLETTSLANGIYAVVVTATDTRGNSGSARQIFTVLN